MPARATSDRGPMIAIAGLGGSGTRVVAQLCERLGVAFGRDLNDAHDDLLFTLLLKRPTWYRECVQRKDLRAVELAVAGYEEVRFGGRPWSSLPLTALFAAAGRDQVAAGMERPTRRQRAEWTARRVVAAARRAPPAPGQPWGWKEPNTHIFLEQIHRRTSQVRYVHVMRSGADYALGMNFAQLRNWGWMFGINDPERPTPVKMFEYWSLANRRALRLARELCIRTHVVRLEDLCLEPETHIRDLAAFLEVRADDSAMAELLTLPRLPTTAGSAGSSFIDSLGSEARERLEEFGFTG